MPPISLNVHFYWHRGVYFVCLGIYTGIFFLIFEFYIYKKSKTLQRNKTLGKHGKGKNEVFIMTFSAWQLENCKMLEFTM